MSETTDIEWCDSTFNPFIGCMKISPGCDNCYAARSTPARTMGIVWGPGQPRVRTSAANWKQPYRWNDAHAAFFDEHGRRRRVFCASLADVFDNQVPVQWRADLFALIEATPNLDWLLLTKRIGNVADMVSAATDLIDYGEGWRSKWGQGVWPENVWLGATVVNQEEADRDIPKLLAVPARLRFLSMEPLLGPVDLSHIDIDADREIFPLRGTTECVDGDGEPCADVPGVNWVIVGGESGPGARPMHPGWARSLRDQCEAVGVPFLFKQWGEWIPGGHFTDELSAKDSDPRQSRFLCARWIDREWAIGRPNSDQIHFSEEPMYQVGKRAAGRELDERTSDGFPA